MVRRTKQQKMKAQERRAQQPQYTYQAPVAASSAAPIRNTVPLAPSAPSAQSKKEDLFGYNTSFIFRDLRKTIIVTVLILVCLIGIFLYTRK